MNKRLTSLLVFGLSLVLGGLLSWPTIVIAQDIRPITWGDRQGQAAMEFDAPCVELVEEPLYGISQIARDRELRQLGTPPETLSTFLGGWQSCR